MKGCDYKAFHHVSEISIVCSAFFSVAALCRYSSAYLTSADVYSGFKVFIMLKKYCLSIYLPAGSWSGK